MDDEKKYGGTALFFGILVLICSGLTAYYINFISVLSANNQTYGAISVNPSAFEKLLYKYLSIFDKLFGKTPSTPALAVIIPITIIFVVVFCYYLYMFIIQKKAEKLRKQQEQIEKKLFEEQLLKESISSQEETAAKGEENNDQSAI